MLLAFIPAIAPATAGTMPAGATSAVETNVAVPKLRFWEQRGLKMLQKRVKKWSLARRGPEGKVISAIGLSLGILTLVLWFISPILGVLATIPLTVAGSILSIIGLINARRHGTRRTRGIAIAGIVLNGSLLVLFLLLLVLIYSDLYG
jgi:hypothetical protein